MSDEETPAVVEDLALGAFRMVKNRLDFELDFTPETLPVVDHYLQQLREEDGGRPDEETVSVVAPCVGAYFGEVVRRSLPGLRWHAPADDYASWRLEGERVFLCFNPIGAALEALFREAVDGWNAHFTLLPEQRTLVNRSLEATGAVREDDYYRLAVRHEALEQALGVLENAARQKDEPRAFGRDVYASAMDGESPGVDA
jgi:hypothetical protein